jgi:hypothetical protein
VHPAVDGSEVHVKGAVMIAAVVVASAWASGTAAAAPHTIVVAPLSALGTEDTSASAKQIQTDLEKAVAGVDGAKVITSKEALAAIKKAKKPELRVCENDLACLASLGKLVGADLVIAGEAGGLGEVKVVYLELVDVATAKEVRNTTLETDDVAGGGSLGAAYRLLAPDEYTGTTTLTVDTKGATIYVDGKRLGKSPLPAAPLAVGTHALRVTHPDYRDFVRFVDVGFHADTAIDVKLQEFPVISTEIKGTGPALPASNITYIDHPTPWYRKWWSVAVFSGIVVIATAATAGVIADGVDADTVRPVTPP